MLPFLSTQRGSCLLMNNFPSLFLRYNFSTCQWMCYFTNLFSAHQRE